MVSKTSKSVDGPRLNYYKAVVWFVLSLIMSCGNDAITKYVGMHISPWQVTFFRCFFGAATLLPFMLYQGSVSFKTQIPWLHVVRGGPLFIAMSLWSHSIKEVPVTTATIMSFTVPLFVLLLASIFLQESVTWSMWIATLMGFGGIVLVLPPIHWSFSSTFVLFISAAMLFGLLDIINKKYVEQESMLCMLFYSTLTATLLLALPAMYVGHMPTGYTLLWLLGLGIGSNLILYFLLKSFTLTTVSSLAPFRYLELLISTVVGYVFFGDLPTRNSYWGAAIIILCTLFVIHAQRRSAGSSKSLKK